MIPSTKRIDIIAKVQDQFALLGRTYAAAIGQCERGGKLQEGEEAADAKQINKVFEEALKLIDELPDDEDDSNEKDGEVFKALTEEDQRLEEELAQTKDKAERALEKIKKLRVDLAAAVLKS